MSERDTIYQTPKQDIHPFRFDAEVARVFEDMLQRSVPGYDLMLHGVGVAAAQFVQPGTAVYDLGCSLGGASMAVLAACPERAFELVAIDSSAAMIERCNDNLARLSVAARVETACEDAAMTTFRPSSMVILNLTLQFVPLKERGALLARIYDALLPGGALILSEKIAWDTDAPDDDLFATLYAGFKKQQGYSDLEIAQKRSALEQVLVPETLDTHHNRLEEAGFGVVREWFRCFNFSSFLAVK